MKRVLRLDICDYQNKKLCSLYDSTAQVTGQAYDVFINYERNGWKELTFSIPSTVETENGTEPNFRIDYLVADFRIKATDDKETDWYIISEPKITHNAFARSVEVRAGHVSQILKTKALELEFSDEEGNNVGTAEQLLTTILEGTGWTPGVVYEFLEDDKLTVKVRTLNASSKTGALSLINNLCELFDAKAIYHGNDKTVDLLPLNPFSEDYTEGTPAEVNTDNAFELHYSKNMKSVSRTLNTDNLVTRLYAQGAYGNVATGICNIQTCKHLEYTFTGIVAGNEYKFVDNTGAVFYFYVPENKTISGSVVWSKLDLFSRSYVYDTNKKLFFEVTKKPQTENNAILVSATPEELVNYVPFIMNFEYFRKIGLMNDSQFLSLVKYQREMPGLYKQSTEAAKKLSDAEIAFSEIAEPRTGFLKLKVSKIAKVSNHVRLALDKTVGDNGVIYRSDYDVSKKNYFSWFVAGELKENGDPISKLGSIVFIIHSDNTWHTAYVERIYNSQGVITDQDGNPTHFHYGLTPGGDPTHILLNLSYDDTPINLNTDKFYLFCANSMSGALGTNMAADEAVVQTLEDSTKSETVKHPVFFNPEVDNNLVASIPANEYGWLYQCDINARKGSQEASTDILYFCNKSSKETSWHRVYTAETIPAFKKSSHAGNYFFNLKEKTLWLGGTNKWLQMTTKADERLSRMFSTVLMLCQQRSRLYKGWYETYTREGVLNAGNYAVNMGYNSFALFSTDQKSANSVEIDTVHGRVYPVPGDETTVVSYKTRSYDTLDFPSKNIVADTVYSNGNISSTGVDIGNDDYYRTGFIRVYENTVYQYKVPQNVKVYFYDQKKTFLKRSSLTGDETDRTFRAPAPSEIPSDVNSITDYKAGAYYMRLAVKTTSVTKFLNSTYYIRINDYSNKLVSSDKIYTIVSGFTGSGNRMGIDYLMPRFATLADSAYYTRLNALTAAQTAIKNKNLSIIDILGDMLRDGYWQDDNYVEDKDEERLYKDALDNLKEISKPETTYDIDFLDLYEANQNMGFSITPETDISWPDIQITDAVHMIDEEIDTNCWAYVDKLNKCYDQPWKTTLEINTKLSLIDQHDFTDVMSHIAEVAKETKAKQTLYKRAAALTGSGQLAASKLEGTISAYITSITGGASSWYTDEKGNIVFVSSDGQSAMTLSGSGLCIADSKNKDGDWNWRTAATGSGIVADAITAGTISAVLIEAGAITTDKLSASVGNELEISSNQALTLFATADGARPAGSLVTGKQETDADGNPIYSKVGAGESYIQIAPKIGSEEAHIDIMSGGNVNIEAGSTLGLKGSEMTLNGTSSLTVSSGGTVKIQTGSKGKFVVDSPNFKIDETTNNVTVKGNITTTGGKIAGFTIGQETKNNVTRDYLYSGSATSVDSKTSGVYLGTDGINIAGGAFVVKAEKGSLPVIKTSAANIYLGSVTLAGTLSDMSSATSAAMSAAQSAQTSADSKAKSYVCDQATILSKKDFVVGDVWKDSGSSYGLQYVCKKKYDSSYKSSTINNYWSLVGTSIVGGAKLAIDTTKGTINMVAANTITIAAGSKINIGAGDSINITTAGTMTVGNGANPFIIGATSGANGHAYIYNGVQSFSDDKHNGIYLGTDGIVLGKQRFSVDISGNLTAKSANIEGTIVSEKGSIGGFTIKNGYLYSGTLVKDKNGVQPGAAGYITTYDSNFVGIGSTTTYAFWAGGTTSTSTSPFRVTKNGVLTATSGTIGGWTLGTGFLGDSADLSKCKVAIIKANSDDNLVFLAGANGTDVSTAKFKVTRAGKLTATSAVLGGWKVDSKYLYADAAASTTVKLDGSNDLYNLSWYDKVNKVNIVKQHMFAMWAGATNPENAPFSVTKDGTVTIEKLRVNIGTDADPKYVEVDFKRWLSKDDSGGTGTEEWAAELSEAMGKLKFQTIKSIKKDSTGKVTIYYTSTGGGTSSINFNTASSTYLDISWTGGSTPAGAHYSLGTIKIKTLDDLIIQTKNVYANEIPENKCVEISWSADGDSSTIGGVIGGAINKYTLPTTQTHFLGWQDGWEKAARRVSFPITNIRDNKFTFRAPDLSAPSSTILSGTDRVGEYRIFQTFTNKNNYYVYVKGGVNNTEIARLQPTLIYNGGVHDGEAKFSPRADITPIGSAVHFKSHPKSESPTGTWYSIELSGGNTYYSAGSKITGLYTKTS